MSKLKRQVSPEERSKLPDVFQALYDEQGVFNGLELEPGWAIENVAGLKSALSKERTDRSADAEFRKQFEGLDIKQVLAGYERFKDADKWTPAEDVQAKIEARVRQVEDKYKGEVTERDSQNQFLMSEVERVLIESSVARATERRPDNPTAGSFALLVDKVRKHTRVDKGSDGRFRTIVLEEDGKTPRITTKQGSTEPMTIQEFLVTLKSDPEYSRAFDGPKSTGSGGTGRVGTGTNTTQIDPTLPPEERMAIWRRANPQG